MGWLKDLRLRWALRGSPGFRVPLATPSQQVDDGEEAFRIAHGYSRARVPMPWSEDIEKHNAEVEAEYRAEVERRKGLMRAGEYRPRFVVAGLTEMPDKTNPEHVDWDLEMSADPGRRVDVTKDVGVPTLPVPTEGQTATIRATERLERGLSAAEGSGRRAMTVRDLIGSRETILAVCHENEEMADQVEARALEAFKVYGVTSLDDPLPEKVEQ